MLTHLGLEWLQAVKSSISVEKEKNYIKKSAGTQSEEEQGRSVQEIRSKTSLQPTNKDSGTNVHFKPNNQNTQRKTRPKPIHLKKPVVK